MVYDKVNYDLEDKKLNSLRAQVNACARKSPEKKLAEYELETYFEENYGITITNKGKTFMNCNTLGRYLHRRLKAIMVGSNIYLYNKINGIYEFITELVLKKFMREILSDYNLEIWNISNENKYYTVFLREIEYFNSDPTKPNYIVFKNGVYNIKKKCFHRKFSPRIYAFSSLDYDYDENAKAPTWINTVKDIFNYNEEIVTSLQELFGYCFYNRDDYPIQKIFIFYGRGRNGKGLICNVLEQLLGQDNVSHVFLDDLQDRFGKQNLHRKVLNISSEADQKKPFNTSTLKSITGGDRIEIERKYEQSFTDRITCKFIVCSNHSIKTDDNSIGFFERLHVFEFQNIYKEIRVGQDLEEGLKTMDKQLGGKLKKELSGIFNWALEGYYRLETNKWNMSKCTPIQDVSMRYFIDANPVEHFFHSCIINGSLNDKIQRPTLYQNFSKWAQTNSIDINGFHNKNEFYKRAQQCLKDMGAISDVKKTGDNRVFVGIKMQNNWLNNKDH